MKGGALVCSYDRDLVQFLVLLFDRLDGRLLLVFKHASSCSLLDHCQDLDRAHVENLCDVALHDQKVRVVDIELDRLEQVGDHLLLHIVAVDQVLVVATDDDLAGDGDGLVLFVANGRRLGVFSTRAD